MASGKPQDEENTNIAGPVDPGIAQLIREEVQATIREVHETFYAPPSYDSSAPLLHSSPTEDEADTEAQQGAEVTDQKPAPASITIWDLMKLFITMAPIITVCLSWVVLISTGVDPLAFSMLAFFLVMALIWCVIAIGCVQMRLEKVKGDEIKKTSSSENQGQASKNWKQVMFMSLSILGIYVMFYGIIWGWAVTFTEDAPSSVWHNYRVSHDLQGKIDEPHVLATLRACLKEAIPERNATITDISTCLKAMGMNDSYVE